MIAHGMYAEETTPEDHNKDCSKCGLCMLALHSKLLSHPHICALTGNTSSSCRACAT